MENEKALEAVDTEKLIVHFLVNLPESLGYSPLIFHRWLPRECDCLIYVSSDYHFRLWCDLDCLNTLFDVFEDDIPKMINILVGKIHVEVTIHNIASNLAHYIFMCGENLIHPEKHDLSSFSELKDAFNDLAKKIYIETIDTINTVISIIRTERGHYWSLPLQYEEGNEMSFFVGSQAKVKSTSFPYVPWHPPMFYSINCNMESTERFIHQDDWIIVQEKISRNRANSLPKELIVYSEQLLAEGHQRSSLILAVVALELVISSFMKSPHLELKIKSIEDLRGDLEIQSLGKLNEKLGLRGTIAVLLPLILTEDRFPPTLIQVCKEAVDVRGNIVHKGQKRLETTKTRDYLAGIRSAIEILNYAEQKKTDRAYHPR